MSPVARWWTILRPPILGLAAVLLVSVAAGLVIGHADLWRNTLDDRGAQDFGVFLESARQSLAGGSLYAPARLRSATGRSTTAPLNLNLPHSMLLVLPLARLSDSRAVAVWTFVGLVLFALASLASIRALGLRPPALVALAATVYLIAWAPSAAFTLTAQICFYLMALVCAAWLADRQGKPAVAGTWLGIAAAVKPFMLVFLPYFLVRREWRAAIAMSGASVAVFVVGVLMFGPHAYAEWLAQLPRITWSGHFFNASFVGLLERTLGAARYGSFLRAPHLVLPAALVLSLAVGIVTLSAVARPSREATVDDSWALLLLAALLISPLGWVYYLWIALWPVVAVLVARAPWRHPTRHDLWLVPGLGGWLWWGRMTEWGQPHPVATLTASSLYFWALLSLWLWLLARRRPQLTSA